MVITALAGLAAACGSGPAADGTPRPQSGASAPATLEGRTVDGCFVMEGAPDPLACATVADCMSGGLLHAGRCCMTGVTHTHSRAYHAWQTELFRARCDTACVEPPSPPLDCEMTLRCDEGRCRDACGEIPATSDAELDAMDRGELEAACERGSTAACDRLGH